MSAKSDCTEILLNDTIFNNRIIVISYIINTE